MGRAPAPVVPRSRRQALSAASAASMSRSSCSGARISISPNTAACPHPDRAAMVGTDAETSNSAMRGTLRPRTSAQSGHVKRIRGCSGSCDEATPPRSERGRENGDDRVRRASASHNRAACRHTRSAMSRSVLLRWHVRPLWRSTVRPVAWIVTIIDLRHSEAISSAPRTGVRYYRADGVRSTVTTGWQRRARGPPRRQRGSGVGDRDDGPGPSPAEPRHDPIPNQIPLGLSDRGQHVEKRTRDRRRGVDGLIEDDEVDAEGGSTGRNKMQNRVHSGTCLACDLGRG